MKQTNITETNITCQVIQSDLLITQMEVWDPLAMKEDVFPIEHGDFPMSC